MTRKCSATSCQMRFWRLRGVNVGRDPRVRLRLGFAQAQRPAPYVAANIAKLAALLQMIERDSVTTVSYFLYDHRGEFAYYHSDPSGVDPLGSLVKPEGRDLAKALVDPALVDKLACNAYTVESSSPDELARFLKADTEKWEAIIKTMGIKID